MNRNLRRVIRAPCKTVNTLKRNWGDQYVTLNWATEGVVSVNWGDKLNPYLAEAISGKQVLHRAQVYPWPHKSVHYWIGSHLATGLGDPDAEIWGAGFISATVPIAGQPKAIHAVRGWLSAERLQKAGYEAPDVVGDAALLLPRFYQPKPLPQRYSLGVIPHCYEWNEPFYNQTKIWDDTLVIDITGGIETVVDQIAACDQIISSSLHGIICAHAYGIPALWLHASDKPVGDGFKFRDYFSSVGQDVKVPVRVDAHSSKVELEANIPDSRIKIDLEALWNACPLKPE